jgi:hypothetical protein
MNFLTDEKIEEKSINDFIDKDLYELKNNREFKLFSLNDKDINGDEDRNGNRNIAEKFELIAQPENGIDLFIK